MMPAALKAPLQRLLKKYGGGGFALAHI